MLIGYRPGEFGARCRVRATVLQHEAEARQEEERRRERYRAQNAFNSAASYAERGANLNNTWMGP